MLAPLSVAPEVSFAYTAKFARLGCTGLVVLLALGTGSLQRMGSAARTFSIFVFAYFFSAAWCPAILVALLFKGMFVLTFLSGVGLAMLAASPTDIKRSMRMLALTSAVAGWATLLEAMRNPAAFSSFGRLEVLGINPNMIGITAAPMLILCVYLALFEISWFWRTLGIATAIALAMVLVYTGSRASVGLALVGSCFVALPLVHRRGKLLLTMVGVATIVLAISQLVTFSPAVSRFTQNPLDSRQHVWSIALKFFFNSPLIGNGMILDGGRSQANLCSIYMQTLAETGIIGTSLLGISIVTFLGQFLRQMKSARRHPIFFQMVCLSGAFVIGAFAHGIAESGDLSGSTVTALLLGFGLALLGRTQEWSRRSPPVRPHFPADPRLARAFPSNGLKSPLVPTSAHE